jgi:hypothetical protein
VRRIESVDALASLEQDEWPELAVDACRLAFGASGLEDPSVIAALRAVEVRQLDPDAVASMLNLAERLDEEAWAAQESAEQDRYDLLFRRSRAVSALAFALSGAPDEAIYEAAHAVGTPEDLVRSLQEQA